MSNSRHRVLIGLSDPTRRHLVRGRMSFLLLPFLGAVALIARLVTDGSPRWVLIAAVAAGAVLSAVVLAMAFVRDRRARERVGGHCLFASFGRFQFHEAASHPSLSEVVTGVNRRQLDIARGLVEGTIAVRRHHILFEPERIASKAGVRRFVWAWEEIDRIEIGRVPFSFGLGSAVRIVLRDGAVLNFQVRGRGKLEAALTAALHAG